MPNSIFDTTPSGSVLSTPVADTSQKAKPVTYRSFTDPIATRKNIYDRVLEQMHQVGPLSNARHTLELLEPKYVDPEDFDYDKQKHAILTGGSLYRRIKGKWRLTDNATGNVLDEKEQTVAQVPYMSPRGTFVLRGTEYTQSSQPRLRPGIFTRIKDNGEIESHVNVMPGNGVSHRYFLDPETGVFKIHIGQAKLPLMPVLKALGVSDTELRKHWGDELLSANLQSSDGKTINKLYQRLVRKGDPNASDEDKSKTLSELFHSMKLDPEVTKRTLGTPYTNLSKEAIIDTTKKLIAVSRQEQEPDDRDHMAYQTLHGPEDQLAERLTKDKTFLRQLLWKASFKGNLSSIPPGVLTRQLHHTIMQTGLGQAAEEINPAELLDAQSRATRLGEGGIGSLDAVPAESRSVNPSQLGFIDLIRTPESGRAGVDTRLTNSVLKGSDNKIYAPFIDAKTSKRIYRTPQDVADSIVAFPGELEKGKAYVAAMSRGSAKYVPRESIDYILPHFENAFSPLANMIPGKSALKGQRLAMGSRYIAQALSLINREAPHLQAAMPGRHMDRSFEEEYGKHMGAILSEGKGVVKKVTPKAITVQYDDGNKKDYQLYNNFPYARKSYIHNTPSVQVGQQVDDKTLLAKSNYTDDKGTTALGLNARIAYVPWQGHTFEDAILMSQSMAQRTKSEHMYQHDQEWDNNIKKGLKPFISLFPVAYEARQLKSMDDSGTVKKGTVVKFGDPLILVAEERERTHSQIHRGRKPTFSNKSVTWEHQSDGLVTDVEHTSKGTTVAVKAEMPTEVGDKFCYSEDTELLTSTGWKFVRDVTLEDACASLTEDQQLEYIKPHACHRYEHHDRMYSLETTQVSLLVTENHHLYAKPRHDDQFSLMRADELHGRCYHLKNNATWYGQDPEFVELLGYIVKCGQGGKGSKLVESIKLKPEVYAMLLGAYLSEGNIVNHVKSGTYGIDITQIKKENKQRLITALDAAAVKYSFSSNGDKIRIYSKHFMYHFRQFGKCYEKFIPQEMFNWSKETLHILYDWLMWGDGAATGKSYYTTSTQLANDFQRLCLHIGYAGKINIGKAGVVYIIRDWYKTRPCHRIGIYRKKNEPTINHGHHKTQNGQNEKWVHYDGYVYCVTLPRNHVLYVRRNGIAIWCGNSGRYGGKGVIGEILPDEQMPHDEQGKPFEIAFNPLGIISRINPIQVHEMILSKIADKTGIPYKLEDFSKIPDLNEFVQGELSKHGVKDTETIVDPNTGRKIPNVLTGKQFLMKLVHTSEAKGQSRGIGGYTQEDIPAKGGHAGAKRIDLLTNSALLSHGATEFNRGAHLIRGQKNDAYWQAFMSGFRPPDPEVPLIYRKYVDNLKGSGINVIRDGAQMHILALTDNDLKELAGNRNLENANTVDWKAGLKPKKGGLFDPALTGSHGGNRFSAIKLTEPMVNPAFEEPTRRLLGLTQKKFIDVISGTESIDGFGTGPMAIKKALENIDLKKAIRLADVEVAGSTKSKRDDAIRKRRYLKDALRIGVHPADWILSRAPVIPPIYRPVSVMQGTGMQQVGDANYLYKELFDANQLLKETKDAGIGDISNERRNLYNAFKAVVGLGDPIQPKNQERGVKGLLKHIFGSSPKFGTLQRQLIGATVDMVGSAVIVPNQDLDMDQVGIPENAAWEVYKPLIIRRLVRQGMPRLEAARAVKDQLPIARDAIVKEMAYRPVVITRAPVLHRYGIMGFWPKLMKGNTMQIPPVVFGGFNADTDGDVMNYHVPVTEEERTEIIDKLLPSRNLLSASQFRVHYVPTMEYQGGLYHASTTKDEKARAHTFRNRADAKRAYHEGKISLSTPVEILEEEK